MYRSQNKKLIFLLLSFIDSHFLTLQENNNPCFIPVVIKLSTKNNDQTFGTLKLHDDRWKNFIYDYEENEGENNHYKNNLLCKWIITTENSNQRILFKEAKTSTFNLEFQKNCNYDYLKIINHDQNLKLCGNKGFFKNSINFLQSSIVKYPLVSESY